MGWLDAIIQGVLLGGLYALFATGLSLIFGVMRLVNIAHGDLIVLAAFLGLAMVNGTGVHPFLSLIVTVPVMAGIGYALQRGILNLTLGGDILPPLLVTFGLSIIIQNVLLEVFSADTQRLKAGALETASIAIGDQIAIGWFPLIVFLSALGVIAGLQLLLFRTRLGVAFRATSDDHETAALMGIDNRHVFALAMALALAVVALAGTFMAIRTNFSPAIGPARLLYAFEAVIIGGLGSLWGTLAGGVILGVAQAIGAKFHPGGQILAGHVAFLIVLVLQAQRALPADEGPVSEGAAAYRVERGTRASRYGALIAVLGLIVLISLPFWGGRADMRTIVEIAYYLALAQLWNLLAGYAGLVSVGQQAFLGLGGYALFVFAMNAGVHPIAAIPLAGIAAALFAVPTAFIVFRLRGAYFAIGTWVVAEVYMLSFAQVSALGGGSGMSLPAAVVKGIATGRMWRESAIYWTGLAIAVGAIALVYLLLRSRHGLALTAIRDSEAASGSLGVDNFRTKLWVYIVAAFGTGMVGALVFLTKLRISPEAGFNVVDWTANVIFIVVIGGIGTIEGPIIGVIVFFVLRELLADFGSWYLIVLGAAAVLMMLRAPQGVWGLIAERFDLRFFPVQRRLVFDPASFSFVADTQEEGKRKP